MATTNRMRRCVEPEWLDELPANDGRAVASRHDLQRLNAVMGHARFVAGKLAAGAPVHRIIDLGAGDGRFLLRVAKLLLQSGIEAVMIDRMALVEPALVEAFGNLGWRVTTNRADVFEALDDMSKSPGTAIVSNLFLHHFADKPLRRLLAMQADLADTVIACEPRRSRTALLASRLVGLIGCNVVTRHDAVASVRAGFQATDLTLLWSDLDSWSIEERSVGLFSHGFVCRRKGR